MSQVSAASSTEKHSCCNTHLRPLLERIDSIEKKMLIETERREKQYNELLHILLVIKKKKGEQSNTNIKIDSQKLLSPKSIILDRGKAELRKQLEHFKQKRPVATEKGDIPTSAQQLPVKEQSITLNRPASKARSQIRKASLNRKQSGRVKTIEELKVPTGQNLTESVTKMQQDMRQAKELSNYLMEQMLALFERVNIVQSEVNSSPKGIPTQQTITSIVLDANQQQQLRDAQKEPEQNSRLLKLQEMLRINKQELRISERKINQQQNILSDLIALTRTLSSRISEIPLLSPTSLSPSK